VRVCLGGTFDRFHVGHEALLRTAAEAAEEVFVGVTAGGLAARDREVEPWERRAAAVESFLRDRVGFRGLLVVRRLTDPMGPAATGDYDAIAVSPETRRGAEAINRARADGGLAPLEIRIAPHVLGEDRLPVSATMVAQGRVDRKGGRLRPVRVAVGSTNPVKVDGVRRAFAAFLGGLALDLVDAHVESGVAEQPRLQETMRGARERARRALAAVEGADYAVGVEAGLSQDPAAEAWYDVQACVVLDRAGGSTDGWGPAFRYPDWVTRRALAGEMVSEILGPVADDPRIGGTTGAVGYLSDGLVDRAAITEMAVRMALVPRVRPDLYEGAPVARGDGPTPSSR